MRVDFLLYGLLTWMCDLTIIIIHPNTQIHVRAGMKAGLF